MTDASKLIREIDDISWRFSEIINSIGYDCFYALSLEIRDLNITFGNNFIIKVLHNHIVNKLDHAEKNAFEIRLSASGIHSLYFLYELQDYLLKYPKFSSILEGLFSYAVDFNHLLNCVSYNQKYFVPNDVKTPLLMTLEEFFVYLQRNINTDSCYKPIHVGSSVYIVNRTEKGIKVCKDTVYRIDVISIVQFITNLVSDNSDRFFVDENDAKRYLASILDEERLKIEEKIAVLNAKKDEFESLQNADFSSLPLKIHY